MFTITHLQATNTISATVVGFFKIDEVAIYAAEMEPLIEHAASRPEGYCMLLDVSGCTIQSQDVLAAFQQHLARVPKARLCAVVTGYSPVRLQARRLIDAPTTQMFETRQQALAWLIEARASAATRRILLGSDSSEPRAQRA